VTLPPLPATPSSPTPTVTPLTPVSAPPSPSVVFPLRWLLEHAAAPIKYRALVEVAKIVGPSGPVGSLPFTHRPAL